MKNTAARKKAERRARKPRTLIKPRKWREALNALRCEDTYEDLERIERHTKPTKIADESRRVPISELVVVERAFQWRSEYSDLHAEERHMRELTRTLELGRNLQRIVVISLGKKLYVVDGHHRLAAYAALGKKQVPVDYFKGSLQAAFFKSLDANIRDKLPITRKDKLEAAFRLVKHKVRHHLSMPWEEIAQRAVVSERLVYKMRAVLQETPQASEWSWGDTLGKIRDSQADYRPGSDEFRNEHARKMADQIMSKVGLNLTANPDITAMALAMISEELPRALIEEWEEEAMEFLIQQAREANSEDTEQVLKEAFGRLSSAKAAAIPDL